MVNKAGLQAIGWVFGGTTAAVLLIAAVLVGQAIAAGTGPEQAPAFAVSVAAD
jgi:hypothetical protein